MKAYPKICIEAERRKWNILVVFPPWVPERVGLPLVFGQTANPNTSTPTAGVVNLQSVGKAWKL